MEDIEIDEKRIDDIDSEIEELKDKIKEIKEEKHILQDKIFLYKIKEKMEEKIKKAKLSEKSIDFINRFTKITTDIDESNYDRGKLNQYNIDFYIKDDIIFHIFTTTEFKEGEGMGFILNMWYESEEINFGYDMNSYFEVYKNSNLKEFTNKIDIDIKDFMIILTIIFKIFGYRCEIDNDSLSEMIHEIEYELNKGV